MRRYFQLILILANSCGLVGIAGVAFQSGVMARDQETLISESTVTTYTTTKANRDYRVTLLGVTKGVSFLDSQEPVSDGRRKHGENVVPWMRIATMIETLGDKHEPLGFKAETADGRALVGKTKIEVDGNVIESQGEGTAEMDLDFGHLASAIFPTAPPNVDQPKAAKVYVFTLSGNFRTSESATLRFQFGNAPQQRELVFDKVPLP